MLIYRYPHFIKVHTVSDPLTVLSRYLEFLTSKDYLVDILVSKHGIPKTDATFRFTRVGPHIKAATAYIDQALSGPSDVAFLPAYYAILNLMKVYVLFSNKHQLLRQNRWHGATYDVYRKDSHNLATEFIVLRKGGAIPLFYEAVTGQKISKDWRIRMDEIYQYIIDISAEWSMASGKPLRMAQIEFETPKIKRQIEPVAITKPLYTSGKIKVSQLKVLKDFRNRRGYNQFVGKRISLPRVLSTDDIVRNQLNPFLLYYPAGKFVLTPICGKSLLMLE